MTLAAPPPRAGALPAVAERRAELVVDARAWLRREPSLPPPGGGATLARWRALAAIAAVDVSLAKLLEAHHDAREILRALAPEAAPPDDRLLAVWAAEPPDARLAFMPGERNAGTVSGTKAWCSGGNDVDAALVTACLDDAQVLVLVERGAAGMSAMDGSWRALGMSRVDSGRIRFEATPVRLVAGPGEYLARPGFWHGGAGIAACWFGGVQPVAQAMLDHPRTATDPLMQAHGGVVDMALHGAACVLRALAATIDATPGDSHRHDVVRARAIVERACSTVLDRAARALGPAPMCQDAAHATRVADLAVFLRQSHADRDWAALGAGLAGSRAPWAL